MAKWHGGPAMACAGPVGPVPSPLPWVGLTATEHSGASGMVPDCLRSRRPVPWPPPARPALPPGLMLKVFWMELRRMQVTVLVTACMWEKSCMAHSGKAGEEPF